MASIRRPRQIFPPVTMGHVRSHGCRSLLVYCVSAWCNHGATLNGDWLPDETVLLDLDRRMVCTACGLIGADVRPDWASVTGSAGMGGAHSR
jgi:hypothetical protein